MYGRGESVQCRIPSRHTARHCAATVPGVRAPAREIAPLFPPLLPYYRAKEKEGFRPPFLRGLR